MYLQDLQSFAPLQVQNLSKNLINFFRFEVEISAEICAKINIFQQFSWKFLHILMKIYRHFAKYFAPREARGFKIWGCVEKCQMSVLRPSVGALKVGSVLTTLFSKDKVQLERFEISDDPFC